MKLGIYIKKMLNLKIQNVNCLSIVLNFDEDLHSHYKDSIYFIEDNDLINKNLKEKIEAFTITGSQSNKDLILKSKKKNLLEEFIPKLNENFENFKNFSLSENFKIIEDFKKIMKIHYSSFQFQRFKEMVNKGSPMLKKEKNFLILNIWLKMICVLEKKFNFNIEPKKCNPRDFNKWYDEKARSNPLHLAKQAISID